MNAQYERSLSATTAPSFCDRLIIEREEAVKQQLAIYLRNLARLELRKARHGMDPSTQLLNEIDYTREQIDRLIRELQCKEGILRELVGLRGASVWNRAPAEPHTLRRQLRRSGAEAKVLRSGAEQRCSVSEEDRDGAELKRSGVEMF